MNDTVRNGGVGFEPFLSDAAVSGHLKSGSKRNTVPLDGHYINVFDDIAEKGALNVTNTGTDGYFEVSPEMASSLGHTLLLKPLVNEDLKPHLVFDNPFSYISEIRQKSKEKHYPTFRRMSLNEPTDTMDFSDRHVVQLVEFTVKDKGNRFPKRNKVMGYLDSLALNLERAWICGCHGAYGRTFLNDYIDGYTHHPNGTGTPHKIEKPQRGVTYELIKYSGPTAKDYVADVADIQYLEYHGQRYSEEDLLQMNGLWKTEGYHTRHRFRMPSEDELVSGVKDFRNTLLWLPRAQTDENGELSITIPTSDVKSTFKVQILTVADNACDMNTKTEYFTVR